MIQDETLLTTQDTAGQIDEPITSQELKNYVLDDLPARIETLETNSATKEELEEVTNSVATERDRAMKEEADIKTSLENETTERTSSITSLQESFNLLPDTVASLVDTRISATNSDVETLQDTVKNLQSSLTADIEKLKTTVKTINTELADETANRISADNELTAQIEDSSSGSGGLYANTDADIKTIEQLDEGEMDDSSIFLHSVNSLDKKITGYQIREYFRKDGTWFKELEQTVETTEDNGVNILTAHLVNGDDYDFKVRNGSRGNGIKKIDTKESDANSGTNTLTITETDGAVTSINIKNGVGLETMQQTAQSTEGSAPNVFTFEDSAGHSADFTVYNGNGIAKIETTETDESGGINTIKITDTNGKETTLNIKNGISADLETENQILEYFEKINANLFAKAEAGAVLVVQEDGSLKWVNLAAAQCPFPVGATYTQYPNQKAPADLWDGTSWENISSQFAGNFFRAEGGNASAFGSGTQAQSVQSHAHGISEQYIKTQNNGLTNGDFLNYNANGSLGGWGMAGTTNNKGTSRLALPAHNTNNAGSTETRPKNMTIRIWLRTA